MTRQMLMQAGRAGRPDRARFRRPAVLLALACWAARFFCCGANPNESDRRCCLRHHWPVRRSASCCRGSGCAARRRGRRNAILRALPDALDMLTIGVEAGLAFESALVRVGEKWDNALTPRVPPGGGRDAHRHEPRRGAAAHGRRVRRGRSEHLRGGAGAVQQLGVSIAQVLHTQAAEMRAKRRQRAEELARQAGVKMVFPLVF